MDQHNGRGVELLCEVVHERAASLLCPGCNLPLTGVQIEVREMAVDRAVLDLICRSCGTQFRASVMPAGEGVAIGR